jgi:hypothetical protein
MNEQKALIRLDWQHQAVGITESAQELKAKALELAGLIGKVCDATTQEEAVRAQREISDLINLTEKARKAAKEGPLQLGRLIDDTAKSFLSDLKDEQLRIAALVGNFQQLELAKQRAAERARIEEERKLAEERRQAELAAVRAAEAERAKLAAQEAEIARLAAAAKSKREAELLAQQQAEIDRQKKLAEAKSHEELDRIQAEHSNAMAAIAEAPKYEAVRSAGQRVEEDWAITVSDVWALARAHPGCVKIEPLVGQIKAMLKAGVTKIPGVTATPIVKAGVTRGRQPAAIEV